MSLKREKRRELNIKRIEEEEIFQRDPKSKGFP